MWVFAGTLLIHVACGWRTAELPSLSELRSSTTVGSSTIVGKVLMGYQGWFSMPGDGVNTNWHHWSLNQDSMPAPGNLHFDLFPDLREYPSTSLFSTGLKYANGSAVKLFSSVSPGVVDLHVRWARDYGLDGFLVQRFLNDIKGGKKAHRDSINDQMAAAVQKYGRTWAVMYDTSGSDPSTYDAEIMRDWADMEVRYTKQPGYLYEKGKPVVCIYGLGMGGKHPSNDPTKAINLINWLKARAFVIGSSGYRWRIGGSDAVQGYSGVYAAFNAIMPWSVGRYRDTASFDRNYSQVQSDVTLCKSRGQYYAPIAFPGFSWFNLKGTDWNLIPRRGGSFFQYQIDKYLALDAGGAKFYYIAMFDEVDESTAIFKAASTQAACPVGAKFGYLNMDGGSFSSDHYLKLAGDYTARARAKHFR